MIKQPEVQFWDMGPPSDPPKLTGKSKNAGIALMVAWFRNNFEDPAEHTPRDSGEWIYVWGGPYDARTEVENAFGNAASAEMIAAAAEQIEEDGYEWAPVAARMRPVLS
jgi:hypothetical protein